MTAKLTSNKEMIRLILVDDSSAFMEFTMKTIKRDPVIDVVDIAFNAEDALWATSKYKPDVILLDIEMPDRSGLEVLPELLEISPDSKIIILTLFDNPGYRLTAELKGAVEFVLKSKIVRDLLPTIRGVFDEH